MEPLKLTEPHYMFCRTPVEEHWSTPFNKYDLPCVLSVHMSALVWSYVCTFDRTGLMFKCQPGHCTVFLDEVVSMPFHLEPET